MCNGWHHRGWDVSIACAVCMHLLAMPSRVRVLGGGLLSLLRRSPQARKRKRYLLCARPSPPPRSPTYYSLSARSATDVRMHGRDNS